MTKAANKDELAGLHKLLTKVFVKVLKQYETGLDNQTKATGDVSDDMVDELMDSGVTISPAMLSAVSKFLKDNEVTFDAEQLEELTALEERLNDKKQNRGNLVSLNTLPRIQNG